MLLAPNSIRWIALDLALMAEGVIVVPLYARQALAELVAHDERFRRQSSIFCHDAAIAAEIKKLWPQAPPISLLTWQQRILVPPAFDAASTTEKMQRVIENAPIGTSGGRPCDRMIPIRSPSFTPPEPRANRKAWCSTPATSHSCWAAPTGASIC